MHSPKIAPQQGGVNTQSDRLSNDLYEALLRADQKPPKSATILKFSLKTARAFADVVRELEEKRSKPLAGAPDTVLDPDREQIKTFIDVLFRYATPGSYVSLRSFHDDGIPGKAVSIKPIKIASSSREDLIEAAFDEAWRAAHAEKKTVFAPPVATFSNRRRAREQDIIDGLDICAELDAQPQQGLTTLEELLGPATIVVASGGTWRDPKTGKLEPKLHAHWRLNKPAQSDDLKRLKEARGIAIDMVGGDPTHKSIVHPIRWSGSWHRKGDPVMCEIVRVDADREIDLTEALEVLRKAKAPDDSRAGNLKSHGEQFKPPIDIRQALAKMEYKPEDTSKNGNNIHWTQVRCSAALLEKSNDIDLVVEGILEATRKAADKAGEDNWDWEVEETAVRGMCTDWLKKHPQEEEQTQPASEPKPVLPKRTLDDVHKVFRKWLGDEYDLDAIDATCAAGASERLAGDPLWLLIISGPGNAKTETVQSLMGAGAHVTSTIASEGALLSASPKRSRVKTATGGLLRKIGDRGVLVIKDVTSILSADRNMRSMVLAAIREVYDGRWERNVGTDGGQTMTWVGRIVIVGAVTTAWDTAHAVVATMGDRFALLRMNSNIGRQQSSLGAIHNTGNETQMREELAAAVGGLISHASTDNVPIKRMRSDSW